MKTREYICRDCRKRCRTNNPGELPERCWKCRQEHKRRYYARQRREAGKTEYGAEELTGASLRKARNRWEERFIRLGLTWEGMDDE